MTTWTPITKASGTSWTNIPKVIATGQETISAGMPIGFLLALTYASTSVIPGTGIWNKINKATGTNWTKIAKAL